MDCGSAFKESMNSQEKEVQRVLNLFVVNGTSVLLKKEFTDDKAKKNLSKSILFLLEFIQNNKPKEDEAQTSKKKVATHPETRAKAKRSEVIEDSSDQNDIKSEQAKKEQNKNELKMQQSTKTNICFAYKFGKCPYKEKECQNCHPPKCQKFSDYGHFAIDDKGCETQKCNQFHPKLCRNSTASKECSFKKCRFQHLKGTKLVPKIESKHGASAIENKKINVLVNKFMELMMNFVTNHEEGNQNRKS